jgi:glycosyltransferase involved in cell wall biosynthesis
VTGRRRERPYLVSVHGLPTFCEKLSPLLSSERWEVPYRSPFTAAGLAARFNDLRKADLVYTWGGRITYGKFTRLARFLGKKKLIMLWCGSDILFAQQQRDCGIPIEPWIRNKIHWAVSPVMAEEVRAVGLDCEPVQASFVDPVPNPKPLPEKFSVLTYGPSFKKSELYGMDRILEVAHRLPDVEFNLIGILEGPIPPCPPNVKVHGRVDLAPFYEQSTVLYRPVRHDGGISFMVLEALAHGRHVVYSSPFPASSLVTDVEEACRELTRLRNLHKSNNLGLNQPGLEVIARDYSSQKVRADLLTRWERVILSDEREARRANSNTTRLSSPDLRRD